jgi:hypothetical protein
MNNLRRGCLGILAVLITVTLSACSERQGKNHKQREQAGRSASLGANLGASPSRHPRPNPE